MNDPNITRIEEQESSQLGLRVTFVGMGANIFLVCIKLWIGLIGNSQALIADGIHSLSDLISDLIVALGILFGRKGPDEEHHFGHARIETMAGMAMGFVLILAGAGVVYGAGTAIFNHQASHPSILAIVVAGLSVLIKETLFWYTLKVGKKIRSSVIIGNAWHHRTDALSSVAVLIGVGLVFYNPDWYLADSYAALLVSFFIFKIGGSLVVTAFKEIIDTAPKKSVLQKMLTTAEGVEGVREAHDIKARYLGADLSVEVHIVVNPDISVREGHTIAKQVEHQLLTEVPDIIRVITHVDPDPKN